MKYGYGPDAPSIDLSEYEFHCSVPDCTEHSHESEDFEKCASCNCLICAEHAVTPVDRHESYCPEHGVCECGERAYFACDECGQLRCHDHLLFVEHRDDPEFIDDETVIEYFCGRNCQIASEKRQAEIDHEREFARKPEVLRKGVAGVAAIDVAGLLRLKG